MSFQPEDEKTWSDGYWDVNIGQLYREVIAEGVSGYEILILAEYLKDQVSDEVKQEVQDYLRYQKEHS